MMKPGARLMIAATVVLAVAATPTAGRAEADARTFLDRIEDGDSMHLEVLHAYADGMAWANAMLQETGKEPLFCAPEDLRISAEHHADLLRRFVRDHPAAATSPAGLAMLFALQSAFPCDASTG